MRSPRIPARQGRPPTRVDLLDLLDSLELTLGNMMRRWNNGEPIDPRVRVEIMTEAYEPVLQMLIRSRRRPLPR